MIKRNLIYLAAHFGSCLLLFLCVQKPLFLLYNWVHGGSLCTLADWGRIYRHGLALDAATAAYATVVPLLLVWGHALAPRFNLKRLLRGYDALYALVFALIAWADASLYEFWECKLDATIWLYLDDPQNAFASVTVPYLLWRAAGVCLVAAVAYGALAWPLKGWGERDGKRRYGAALAGLAVTGGLLFVAIRGVRIWPNNPGRAYFSKTTFHNHGALNPAFNLVYTGLHREDFDKQFAFFPEEERAQEWAKAKLFPTEGRAVQTLLNTSRPNVLVIVLEGFGACFLESLGGMKNVAPEFNRLLDEGVCFTHCYCSSFRTDRGIVSALSGYLAQPTTSIMKYSRKMASLPGLPKTLKRYGYDTQVLYGGDITFFNMSDYFISCGHDRLVSQMDFASADRTTKWGVPDHRTFEWLLDDIKRRNGEPERPWYTTFLTISSHTPFDVPYRRLENDMYNAFAYTDSCLGHFMDQLKQTPAWENLLVVCIADHGFNHREIASPEFPHIPWLLLGGAVKAPCRIERIVSQTDLPATLLGQLGLPHDDFCFSRDVMADTYVYPFAFNAYNNGFIFRDSTGCTVYDNVAARAVHGADSVREHTGKLILQTLYQDLERR